MLIVVHKYVLFVRNALSIIKVRHLLAKRVVSGTYCLPRGFKIDDVAVFWERR